MSDNWFVQHPTVMSYIMEHETERMIEEVAHENAQRVMDAITHTDAQPFCSDVEGCPCHTNEQLIQQYRVQPLLDGLQTFEEGWWLFRGRIVL